jgi:hypothetical protein
MAAVSDFVPVTCPFGESMENWASKANRVGIPSGGGAVMLKLPVSVKVPG